MRHLFLLLFILSLSHISLAQEVKKEKKKQYYHLSLELANGNIMPTNDFVKGANFQGLPLINYQSYAVRMLWQNPGYRHWQQVFNAPYYGFGVTINNFFNAAELGTPSSLYGVLGLPITRLNRFQLYGEFQFGIASDWVYYDEKQNPFNLAIGSPVTIHVAGGVNAMYNFGDNIDAGLGINFLHFSNGGTERPNRGLNLSTVALKVNYHFGERAEQKNYVVTEPLTEKRSLLISFSSGLYQPVDDELGANYFDFSGLSVVYLEQLSQAFRLGLGGDFDYWYGLGAATDGTPSSNSRDKLTIGVTIQPEIIIGDLTLVGGVGLYLRHLEYGNAKQLYQRLGVRYDIYRNIAIGMNVRAINFMLAETLEFNLAYRIDWNK